MDFLSGRSREMQGLEAFMAQARSFGAALLVTGDPGIGKTELLSAAARRWTAAGGRVIRSSGVQFEAEVSYAGLHQVLSPLLSGLPRLEPSAAAALTSALGLGGGTAPDQLSVAAAALTLVRQEGEHQPLLVVADDVPWFDRSSAIVLAFIARRLAGRHVGLLAAARPTEDSFFDRAGLPTLSVGPLTEEAASELLHKHYPALAARTRQRLLADAAGNPLALLELPAALTSSQRAGKLPSVLPLGRRLQDLFAHRIRDLPGSTRSVLLLAALDGSGDLAVLDAAARVAEPAADLDDLAPAERMHVVSIDSSRGKLAFRHPLTRSAVVELSTSDERRSAHRSLAAHTYHQPDMQAWHRAEASVGPDEGVAALLEAVAYRSIARGDGVGAVEALTRAAELSPLGPERGRRFAEAAYAGADVTGQLENAARLLADAHDADPQLGETLQAAATAAFVLVNGQGDVDTAHRLLVGAIENSRDASDVALAHALNTLTLVCFFGARADLWKPFYVALERLEPNVPKSLRLISQTFADPARTTPEGVENLDRAVADLAFETDPTVIMQIGFAANVIDRLGPARAAFLRVAQVGRNSGAAGLVIQAQVLLAFDSYWTARWDDAVQRAGEVVGLCEKHGFPLFAISARHVHAAIAAARGDAVALESAIQALTAWGTPRGAGLAAQMEAHARSIDALGRGDYEAAYRWSSSISQPGELASHAQFALWVFMDLVESCVRTGRHAEARAHVAMLRHAGVADLSPRLAMLTRAACAMVASDEDAPKLFDEAVSTAGAGQWPFYLARVRLAYGERLRRLRRIRPAGEQLEHAADTFQRLGAWPWLTRASVELRATGVRAQVGAVTPATGPPVGSPVRLTPQEREISELAAAGLTNKQIGERLFLSHRTVGGHLHRLFPKLGVTSRAALRDALDHLDQDV
jgi:DNA-binding CsgD family transcriptional regulator